MRNKKILWIFIGGFVGLLIGLYFPINKGGIFYYIAFPPLLFSTYAVEFLAKGNDSTGMLIYIVSMCVYYFAIGSFLGYLYFLITNNKSEEVSETNGGSV